MTSNIAEQHHIYKSSDSKYIHILSKYALLLIVIQIGYSKCTSLSVQIGVNDLEEQVLCIMV